jgi:uncharacterized OB-fold protein
MNNDEKVRRNRRWQQKKVEEGRCAICGRVSETGFTRCNDCREKNRIYMREYHAK